jgi:hypothetical protein
VSLKHRSECCLTFITVANTESVCRVFHSVFAEAGDRIALARAATRVCGGGGPAFLAGAVVVDPEVARRVYAARAQ